MHQLLHIFDLIFKIPLFNALITIYEFIPGHDLGISIILLTIILRLILWPLAAKALHSQRTLQSLQPQINKIREQHKGDTAKMNAAVMDFYKEKEISPFSSCLPTVIQFPFLIALYLVFIAGLKTTHLNLLYSFVPHPHSINTLFLGVLNLSKPDHTLVLPVLAAGLQYYQSKMLLPMQAASGDSSAQTAKTLTTVLPAMTFFFGLTLPAALPLYWITTTLFAIIQQKIVMSRDIEVLESPPVAVGSPLAAEAIEGEIIDAPKSKKRSAKSKSKRKN